MKNIILVLFFGASISLFAQDDATISQVTFRGSTVYKNDVLFTGTLYSDERAKNNCSCTLIANYLKGKLNGEKLEWYKNGNIKFRGTYKKGKVVGTVKNYDSNGNPLILKYPITEEHIIAYIFKIHQPDNYTDTFLKLYLREYDFNYDNYKNNGFELNRRKNSVLKKIIKNTNSLSFKTIYRETNKTRLPKYSFDSQCFNLKGNGFLRNIKTISTPFFTRTNMTSSDKRMSNELLKIDIANKEDFFEIKLPPKKAEELNANFRNNNLYYTYDYQIMPTKFKFEYGELGNYSVGGILAYISAMHFYSDENLTNLVHKISSTKTYNEVLVELENTKEKSSISIGNKSQIKNIDNEDFLIGKWAAQDGSNFNIRNDYTLDFYSSDMGITQKFSWSYKRPTLKLIKQSKDKNQIQLYSRGGIPIKPNKNSTISIRYLSENKVRMISSSGRGARVLGDFIKISN